MDRYVVTAPYVTLQTMTPQGKRITGFYAGAPVPADVPEWQIKHHLDNNLIELVPEPPKEAPKAASGDDKQAAAKPAAAAAKAAPAAKPEVK